MITPALTPSQLNFAETSQWKEILRQAIADLRVAIPAIVQSVDYSKNPPVVTVQIAINEVVRTPDGAVPTAIYPISNVPIMLPSAGGFSLTLPVAAGDEGMLIFCDMCIDLWWTSGCPATSGTAAAPWLRYQPQNQIGRRRHDLSDCGFAPGLRSQARPPAGGWSPNSARLTADDGEAYIEVAGGHVVNIVAPGGLNITGDVEVTGAVEASGEGTFNSIPVSTHLHSGVTSGASDTGPPVL